MRSRLALPIGAKLLDRCDEAQVARIWRGVSRRREARAARRLLLRAGLAGLGAAGVTVALVLTVWRPQPAAAPGPVAMLDAAPVPELLSVGPRSSRSLQLDDGSRLTLAAGAELRTIENSGRRFAVELRRGRVRFEVKPGGPRRWTVAAGSATVSVTGTIFEVERAAAGLRVAVQRGRVEVQGPDGRRSRLGAGEELSLALVAEGPPRRPPATPPATMPSSPTAAGRATTRVTPHPAAVSSATAVSPSAEHWLEVADAARRQGRLAAAFAALDKAVAGGDDAGVAIAAFTRARLELDLVHRPADAARDLALALRRGLPRALAEEARARLVEAYRQAQRPAEAAAAATDYLRHHPAGRWAERIRRQAE